MASFFFTLFVGNHQKVTSSQDFTSAIEYSIDKIEISLRDIHKSMSETFVMRILSTMKIELNLNDLIIKALAGGFIGSQFNITFPGMVAGGIVSVVKFSLDSFLLRPRQIPIDLKDYTYIYHAETELDAV